MPKLFAQGVRDTGTRARTGLLSLPHGTVETPVFMPVGTNATVKAIGAETLEQTGFRIILANTYHLFLRPGPDIIRAAGGLHGFSGWKGNFLTDSGGYQVFSLSPLRKIADEGVTFRSHIDGSKRFLSPEIAVEVQAAFNSDIQMQLDVCTAWGESERDAAKALRRTTEWARRARARWMELRESGGYAGNLFGIVQGNFYPHLRTSGAEEILSFGLPGIAIGGLSVGEPFPVFAECLAHTAALLPDDLPRYLMGIGTPEYILEAVRNGIDMFDCVYPTRTARNGLLFTRSGGLSIKKACYAEDFSAIDPECPCPVCRKHSRAYLRHLYRNGEILYSMLATHHNLFFLDDFVRQIRNSIVQGTFDTFAKSFLARYAAARESGM